MCLSSVSHFSVGGLLRAGFFRGFLQERYQHSGNVQNLSTGSQGQQAEKSGYRAFQLVVRSSFVFASSNCNWPK